MKIKIIALIIGCIISVVALTTIQGYFIYNTYKLREKEVNSEIKDQLTEFEDTEDWRSLESVWESKYEKFIENYRNHTVTKADFVPLIEKDTDSLSRLVAQYLKKREHENDYKWGYSIYVTSTVINESGKVDTIYRGKKLILNNGIKSDHEILSSEGKWLHNINNKNNPSDLNNSGKYGFIIKTERYYSITSWKEIVLKKMVALLVFSFLLLAFVVLLFYLSLKNLITQKKIADIKTDFINNITHEFQTPLATMDIAVKTLERKNAELSPEHFNNTIALIERQNNRLQKLFRQVTEVSLEDAPLKPNEIQMVGSKEIIEFVEDFKISRPDIQIQCHTEQKETALKVDPFYLNTVLINLLDNAVKYGANQIEVNLNTINNNYTITVKDNAIGIPKKEQTAIFEKFYRIEKGNIHNTKGLGLGLFYIRQIVESYKGTITVESEVGNGSSFIISIPQS
ncbi:sensor histidine kinase [Flavobacterium sp. '19STA2R22 D10 B1']|uniref:sensor histidine kinase n=1 Tax=Flavobacterium aerium TaxID=3037261 RepID=UPI00278C700C|nr:HAMP domain-containing sensor histidine kinase [Flavobacterium sp. '19STA2R22 D10 B1']